MSDTTHTHSALVYDTAAQTLRIQTPGGIELATLSALDLVTVASTILGVVVAKAHGADVPPTVAFGAAQVTSPIIRPV